MAKSLADLRSAPPKQRPERSVGPVCLRPDLVARVQELTGELDNLPESEAPRVRKMAEGEPPPDPREVEIRAELDGVLADMAAHEGDIGIRANRDDGAWRNWVNDHPARPEGEGGHDRDLRVTGGLCDADALIADLGTYVVAWNGEQLEDGDWTNVFAPALGPGDKAEIARGVVAMYEGRTDFRRWRNVLSDGLRKSDVSASPDNSASAPSGSTGGSPQSTTSTSTSATPGGDAAGS